MSLELKLFMTFMLVWAVGVLLGRGQKEGTVAYWIFGVTAAVGMVGFFICAFLWTWK